MKKMIPTLLVTLAVASLFTPTPAFADVYSECAAYYDDLAEIRTCIELERESLLTTTTEAEAQLHRLRQAQASAVSVGDGAEVVRLQQELAAVTAERDDYKSQLDAANAEIRALRGDVGELRNEVAELKGLMTSFLEAEAPVAVAAPTEGPTPERIAPATPEGDTRLAVYERPLLDESVYGRMGWRNDQPKIPDPMAFPDVWWEDAGNCLTVGNEKTDPVNGWVILRIAGKTHVVDSTGHVVANEVPLGPGDTYSFCADSEAPRMSITPAMRSTAPSAERHWSDFERQWVPLQRNHSGTYHPHEWFGADRLYDIN